MRAQQGEISHIGLPRDVKDISGNGNHANHSLKGNITRHAQQNPLGRSQAGGLEDDVGGEPVPIVSPTPGMDPRIPSRPMRNGIPGIANALSST